MHINNLRLVEIEIANYCNRTCGFCPNSKSPRNDIDAIKYLNMESFKNMIDSLQDMGYQGTYTFSRYNEPFGTPIALRDYVSYIRSKCSNKIVTNTNGDFIEKDIIVLFDEISIMDYDEKGISFWTEQLIKLNNGIGIEVSPDGGFLTTMIGNTKVLVFLNFMQNASIEDRGGVVKPIFKMKNGYSKRTRPCFEPMHFIGIDYDGSVMPCCNLRHDFHPNAVLGNINEVNIINILKSDKHTSFLNDAIIIKHTHCKYCQKDPGRYTRDVDPGIDYKGERK